MRPMASPRVAVRMNAPRRKYIVHYPLPYPGIGKLWLHMGFEEEKGQLRVWMTVARLSWGA
jgi:hypothetical protein